MSLLKYVTTDVLPEPEKLTWLTVAKAILV